MCAWSCFGLDAAERDDNETWNWWPVCREAGPVHILPTTIIETASEQHYSAHSFSALQLVHLHLVGLAEPYSEQSVARLERLFVPSLYPQQRWRTSLPQLKPQPLLLPTGLHSCQQSMQQFHPNRS